MFFPLVVFIIISTIIKAQTRNHKWINELSGDAPINLIHSTYYSEIHQTDIGYTIALPPGYWEMNNTDKVYPVIYFLHGGNPGAENRVRYYNYVNATNKIDSLTAMIYVWNNGGNNKSHYDFPQLNSYAESTFIKELIPHIDGNYRTIPDRMARGLQGSSMGGRAAARYIFKYPDMFSVSVSMWGGHQWEKENSENRGNNGEYNPTDNSWDLAKIYSENPTPTIKLYVFIGTTDGNYDSNIAWSSHLNNLGIHHSITIVEGVGHGDLEKMLEQIGLKTIHYIFYQNFINVMDKYNNE